MPSAIVYGGRGALGACVVNVFKQKAWRVISIDLAANPEADQNIVIQPTSQTLTDQAAQVTQELGNTKADAVLCVAGGWQGGNAGSKDFIANADMSIKQSINTSLIAANIAAKNLNSGGLLALTGAVPALQGGTPGMISYGMAKAAVHHMVASLAMPGSGVDGKTVGILPVTLDTPGNRQGMPDADFSTWTPLTEVADALYKWASQEATCESGKLYKVITKDSITKLE